MYVSLLCKLMKVRELFFSSHGIRAIEEFENIRVRVSSWG